MAEAKFYHMYLVPKEGIEQAEIERKLNLALDWFKYDESIWIIYSTATIEIWMKRLKPFAQAGGNLFICELNISNRNGWMSKDFWKWLREKR
jgi:hypothetical protein